jgi:hypothetical protein
LLQLFFYAGKIPFEQRGAGHQNKTASRLVFNASYQLPQKPLGPVAFNGDPDSFTRSHGRALKFCSSLKKRDKTFGYLLLAAFVNLLKVSLRR